MNPFFRMEVLSRDALSELSNDQVDRLNTAAAEAVAELLAEDGNRKRAFLMLVSQALSAMTAYVDEQQAEEGFKILQQVAEGKEPKPAFRNLVHPRSKIYQHWAVFEKEVLHRLTVKMGLGILPTSTASVTRQIFYAGAASMYGLIADRWPEIGSPAGTELMEDLQIELHNYGRSVL